MKKVLLGIIAVFVISASGAAQTVEIGIVHWNDFHSYNLPYADAQGDTVGGYPMLVAYRDSLMALHPNHSFDLHAGDEFQGTPICTLTKGASQIHILNRVHPDAFVLGNHEFDYGRDNLDSLIQLTNFPVLSANIYDERTDTLFAAPTVILQRGGVKIGVIGVTVPTLYKLTLPANVADLKMLNPTTVVRKYAKRLEPKVDLTVVLSHMGVTQDSILAANLGPDSPVDLIVGGHSHTAIFTPREVNGIYIVQAGAHGEYIGYFVADVDTLHNTIVSEHYKLLKTLHDGRTVNPEFAAYIDSLESNASTQLNMVIGHLNMPWKRQFNGESNIGDWQTDVMRQYAHADIAFQNSGGIRKDMPAGPIRLRDMWEMNPFSNHFVVFKVNGKALKQIVLHQIKDPQEFLQLSGLRYTWNKSKQKFTKLQVDGKRIRNRKTYTVVTNNYVFSHFNGFFGIDPKDATGVQHLPKLDRQVFVRAVKQQDTIDLPLQDRVKVVE